MSVPTQGEKFAEFIEHVRKAQEAAAMLGHLGRANDDRAIGQGWLAISEMLKKVGITATKIATGKMH